MQGAGQGSRVRNPVSLSRSNPGDLHKSIKLEGRWGKIGPCQKDVQAMTVFGDDDSKGNLNYVNVVISLLEQNTIILFQTT